MLSMQKTTICILFIYCGVYEDPILIDLNPSRETYKAFILL